VIRLIPITPFFTFHIYNCNQDL